jgi:hypothetical protein
MSQRPTDGTRDLNVDWERNSSKMWNGPSGWCSKSRRAAPMCIAGCGARSFIGFRTPSTTVLLRRPRRSKFEGVFISGGTRARGVGAPEV